MLKKMFMFVLLLLSVFGCNNNVLKPDDFSREAINKKYPYWQVGIERFEIANVGKYSTITIKEKKYILRCMAILRATINTPEFVSTIKSINKEQLRSSVNDSYGGEVLKKGDYYDHDRIIECVRTVKYDFVYQKKDGVPAGTGVGALGKSRYLRYGKQPENEIPYGKSIGMANGDWSSDAPLYGDVDTQKYSQVASLMFHEHMHNIGFNHVDGYDVPSSLQTPLFSLMNRILWKDLTKKYSKNIEELTAYYYSEYKDLLIEDTVFDPDKK